MKQSEQIAALAKALVKARADISHPGQNSRNAHLKNKFADLKQCIDTLYPALAKHSLTVVQSVGGTDGMIEVTTTLLHESGEWMSDTAGVPIDPGKGASKYQSFGSGVTYLRRYGLSAIAGVASDPDDDGHVPKDDAKPASKVEAKPTRQEKKAGKPDPNDFRRFDGDETPIGNAGAGKIDDRLDTDGYTHLPSGHEDLRRMMKKEHKIDTGKTPIPEWPKKWAYPIADSLWRMEVTV